MNKEKILKTIVIGLTLALVLRNTWPYFRYSKFNLHLFSLWQSK